MAMSTKSQTQLEELAIYDWLDHTIFVTRFYVTTSVVRAGAVKQNLVAISNKPPLKIYLQQMIN